MSFDLKPLVVEFANALGSEWESLAIDRAERLPTDNLVWPRLACQLLTRLLEYYPAHESGLPELFLRSIREYHEQAIASGQFPVEQEWTNPSPRQWNRLRREVSWQRLFSIGELLTGMAVAGRYRDQHLMARDVLRGCVHILVTRQLAQTVLAHRRANELTRQAERSLSRRQRSRLTVEAEQAWELEHASRMHLARLRAEYKSQIGLQLLAQIQFDLPARSQTEDGLQEQVRKEFHFLPVYCDWLEEEGDPVSSWLRRL